MISTKKMIHVITNDVTKQFVADAITAVNASPIMSETPEEYALIYPKIDASVINLGMVNSQKQNVIYTACSEASHQNVPMIIDLVGIHFSDYRKEYALTLLNQYPFSIIKGNYDEISALVTENTYNSFDATQPLKTETLQLASLKYPKSIWVATGEIDYICQNENVISISGGSSLLPKVSGTGCVLTGLLGVYLAQNKDREKIDVIGASNLCKAYKIASSRAEVSSKKRLGQFKIDLISEISEIEVLS